MSISRFISTAASGQDFYVKTWHSKTNTKSNVDSSSCSHFVSEIRPPLEKAEVEVIKVMQGGTDGGKRHNFTSGVRPHLFLKC